MSNFTLKRKLDSSHEPTSVPNRSEILNAKLSRRPDRHQLVEQGILFDSQCAPSLQHAEHALKRARLADELNNYLLNRPGPLDLIQDNILHIDKNEHPNLEQAIQGGEIPFKTTSSSRRPLVFHEYTGPPSSCKPKVTKVDSLSSSSNAHQIRLAQQQLLLELTSNTQEEQFKSLQKKPLEQMTLVELRDLCKQYQIPSSHANKTKLIERIKQVQNKTNHQDESPSESNSVDLLDIDIIPSLDMSEKVEVDLFSTSEIDEILQSFSMNIIDREENSSSNVVYDLDISNGSVDGQTLSDDDLLIQMLLETDYSSSLSTETTFDDLLFPDVFPRSSSFSLPRITSIDEFDAFLRDFSLYSPSHQQQEVTTFIS